MARSKAPVVTEMRDLADRAEPGGTLNCADLSSLGIEGCMLHDPYDQRAGEDPCACCPSEGFRGGYSCLRPTRIASGELTIELCCGCFQRAGLSEAELVREVQEELSCL